ncbi:HAMP domain-containing histidine kinase [Blautia producta]|uniref:vancomycin resistance histidine kinase VanS n=1 Tax=Blautia producta TaxID=33035 RepID=UPI001D033A24|nr:vancomycin resistance histidine kinase VanS [Blautia producta]MCB5873768.1 HAMP domain-containing histidine kinase [Blautia producta]
MKNRKKTNFENDYLLFENRLFMKMLLMMVCSLLVIAGVYLFILKDNFANAVVYILEHFIYHDRDEAAVAYLKTFKKYEFWLFLLAILGVFFVVFRMFVGNVSKYFKEINRGIDSLVNEDAQDIVLPAELASTERKINSIRHTLTKRKTDAELAEQRKNDLVMYLAHDLKTPLSSVIGYLTLLRDEGQISDELRERYLSISLDKAERLEDLINEFFEITRFNLSNITLVYGKINLTRMLEQLAYEFKPMLAGKNLKLEFDMQPDIFVSCDANKMQRVFDNLLRNAVSYCNAATSIKIAAEQIEDHVLIKVTNEGNTIPQERLERIFEQFYRLDVSRSSTTGGAGLGLAIAKEIVELHHGQITARSTEGFICFEVSLPLVEKS